MELDTLQSSDKKVNQKYINLPVLSIIRSWQDRHGLRHTDFQSYRHFCSRRIRRLRKSLNVPLMVKSRVVNRNANEALLTNPRFMQITLLEAERCWACAMELKFEAGNDSRKKFHMMSRLRKARQTAAKLMNTIHSFEAYSTTSKLEAQAYYSWMHATLLFQLEVWPECQEGYQKALTIYSKISETLENENEKKVYHHRCDEILSNLRYINFNLTGNMDTAELVRMKYQTASGTDTVENGIFCDEIISSKLDQLLLETQKKRSNLIANIKWQNTEINVDSECVRVFLLNYQDFLTQIERLDGEELSMDSSIPNQKESSREDQDIIVEYAKEGDDYTSFIEKCQEKVKIYEKVLMDCRETTSAFKEELKAKASLNPSDEGEEASRNVWQRNGTLLLSYLSFLSLVNTLKRNVIFVSISSVHFTALLLDFSSNVNAFNIKDFLSSKKTPLHPKKTAAPTLLSSVKSRDIIRLYDLVIQNITDFECLDNFEKTEEVKLELETLLAYFNVFRAGASLGDLAIHTLCYVFHKHGESYLKVKQMPNKWVLLKKTTTKESLIGLTLDKRFCALSDTIYTLDSCFHLAVAYFNLNKFDEATVLFDRVVKLRVPQFRAKYEVFGVKISFQNLLVKENNLMMKKEVMEIVFNLSQNALLFCHTQSFVEKNEKLTSQAQSTPLSDSTSTTCLSSKKFLSDLVEKPEDVVKFDLMNSELTDINLVDFPPHFKAAPFKPIFFDLLDNYVQLPPLEEKLAQSNSSNRKSIAGFVSSWIWGSKS